MRTPVSLWFPVTILLFMASGAIHADDSQAQQQAQQTDDSRWTDSWDPCGHSDFTAATACQAQKDFESQYGKDLTLTGDEAQDGTFDDGGNP